MTSLNNFISLLFNESDCLNACPSETPGSSTGPFTPDHLIQIAANTLYFVQMDPFIRPRSTGVQVSGMVDRTFSTAAGGRFIFSPGVLAGALPETGAVPEPSSWMMMLLGFAAIGLMHRRKRPRSSPAIDRRSAC